MKALPADLPYNDWLKADDMPGLPGHLAVGWSGGADSTALLLALKQAGFQVQAWHVDHAWRDSSERESELLAEKAEAWAIPFLSVRLQPDSSINREAMARQGRFDQFKRWHQETGITTLCLAHHQDDQAETVCMRLLQGAGPGGCQGMRREREMNGLRIIRPLLHVTGLELREALEQAEVGWFEDPSNTDLSIWRNRIRRHYFPAMQQVGVAPEALFMRWQQQAEIVTAKLDGEADAALAGLSRNDAEGICFSWQTWLQGSPAVRARLLQKFMAQMLGEGVTPGRRHIEMVERWTHKSGRGGLDLSRCRLYREREYLHLRPAKAAFAYK